MNWLSKSVALLTLAMAGNLQAAPVGPCLELTGVVSLEHRFGPPNYGQTPKIDEKLLMPFLKIKSGSIFAEGVDGLLHEHTDIDAVQLIGFPRNAWKSGKQTTLTGCFYEADNIRHFSKV